MKNTQVSISTLNRTLPAVSPVNFPKILEENVGNFCPVCGKTIFSNLLEIDGKAYLEKNCCTKELVLVENDVIFFKKYKKNAEVGPLVSAAKNYHEWASENPNYGTTAAYLHVTSKCNQNCPICYMKFSDCSDQKTEPSIEEIRKILKKYNSRIVALTGGEPTARKDIFEIIRAVKKSRNIPAIVTNGLRLEDKSYVKKLKNAGLSVIALQFDGFNKTANIKLRGYDFLEKKLKVLENIEEVGGLKYLVLVPAIHRGLNEKDMSRIIQFSLKSKLINKICFVGLTPPQSWNEAPTTPSDLIKIMERDGYFDQLYFLELVKMYRNIYEITRKIFKGTLLESWFLKRLSGAFNIVHFIKRGDRPQPLFQKEEIVKINEILVEALNKKSKVASLFALLKNSKGLINSSLTTLIREKFFILKKKNSSSSKLLEVGFCHLCGIKNTLLKNARTVVLLNAVFAKIPE